MARSANVMVFPFDCFGSEGTGDGAKYLGDALQEAIDDESLEERETRPRSYTRNLGIGEVEFLTPKSILAWRKTGQQVARELLQEGDFVLWLAGNHLGVLPVLDRLGPDVLVLQFDAHLDLHDFHDTTQELCHGNFLLHRLPKGPQLVNIGHRDLFQMPDEIAEVFSDVFPADALACDFSRQLERLNQRITKAKRIWIDIDVDVLDPVFAPAVHSPLPFGLSPQQMLAILQAIPPEQLIGLSLSEFDPGRDVRDQTLNLLGWLQEWILLRVCESATH